MRVSTTFIFIGIFATISTHLVFAESNSKENFEDLSSFLVMARTLDDNAGHIARAFCLSVLKSVDQMEKTRFQEENRCPDPMKVEQKLTEQVKRLTMEWKNLKASKCKSKKK
nr:uncharacterized protein LOC108074368 [Drosophila kikkawai]